MQACLQNFVDLLRLLQVLKISSIVLNFHPDILSSCELFGCGDMITSDGSLYCTVYFVAIAVETI